MGFETTMSTYVFYAELELEIWYGASIYLSDFGLLFIWMMSPNFANKSQTHERTCLLNYAQVCKIKQKIHTTHVLDSCHRCDKNCMGADGCLKKHGKMCLALR